MVESRRASGVAPTVLVDENGLISFGQNVDLEVATLRATSVNGGHQVDITVVNNINYGVMVLQSSKNDIATFIFDSTAILITPDGVFTEVVSGEDHSIQTGLNYFVYEKNTSQLRIIGSDGIYGGIKTMFDGAVYLDTLSNITSVYLSTSFLLECVNCPLLSDIYAPFAQTLALEGASMTANAIERQLVAAIALGDPSVIQYFFSGGNNAPISMWSSQAISYKDTIINGFGTVTYNE